MNAASALRTLRAFTSSSLAGQSRTYARATLIGNLAGAPTKRESTAGTSYYTYPLAVNSPPKRDASGNVVLGTDGYPVKETDWYTIFSFDDRKAESLLQLPVGSQILVEAKLSTSKSDVDGKQISSTLFSELNRRILRYSKKPEGA